MEEPKPLPRVAIVYVDVIIPVHNASDIIIETVQSAMQQKVPKHLAPLNLSVAVCCYDDGSTDDCLQKLNELKKSYENDDVEHGENKSTAALTVRSKLLIGSGAVARGAGYARNRAASLRSLSSPPRDHFLCLLDSDDTMHPHRIAQQVQAMLLLSKEERECTILGCNFNREPANSTWHYANWANGLSDERLMLERYRECTILQPTWMMTKGRFDFLGGYVEEPPPDEYEMFDMQSLRLFSGKNGALRLVHKTFESPQSMRYAEDLRLMYAHLFASGSLKLLRTDTPLVTYRHRSGMSQSSQTSRKLLLHLRVLAFELLVLNKAWEGKRFVVWGAGRDGKDFVKALSSGETRKRIACFVDVDHKKIETGYYVNKDLNVRIPIVHFSLLAADPIVRSELQQRAENENDPGFGRINKGVDGSVDNTKNGKMAKDEQQPLTTAAEAPPCKKRKLFVAKGVDADVLPSLPVVICVAMYRTNGALERNVSSIGRIEGTNLWHFS